MVYGSLTVIGFKIFLFKNIFLIYFTRRCTINDKVCELIINSGSCENMVSKKILEKFYLKTESSYKLYRLTWLNNDIKIIVDKYCPILFFIGKIYFDNV